MMRYLKFDHKIIKSNPVDNKNGYYTRDEWTSRNNVGEVYNGKVFTLSEYLEVEQRYINTIVDIMKFVGSKYLTAHYANLYYSDKDLLDSDFLSEVFSNSDFYDEDIPLLHYFKTFDKKKRITLKMIDPIARLCMREYMFVTLVDRKHRLKFEFGYDLYLSATCGSINQEQLNKIVRKNDLYLAKNAKR